MLIVCTSFVYETNYPLQEKNHVADFHRWRHCFTLRNIRVGIENRQVEFTLSSKNNKWIFKCKYRWVIKDFCQKAKQKGSRRDSYCLVHTFREYIKK